MSYPGGCLGLFVAQVGNWFNACGGTYRRAASKILGGGTPFF